MTIPKELADEIDKLIKSRIKQALAHNREKEKYLDDLSTRKINIERLLERLRDR